MCHDCVHSLLSRAIVARVPNFLYDCKTYPTLIPSSFTPKTSVRFVLCNGSTRSTTAYFIVLPLNSLHTNFKALSGKKRWVHFQLLKRVNAQHRGIFHTYFSPRSQETRRSHIHPQPFPPPPRPQENAAVLLAGILLPHPSSDPNAAALLSDLQPRVYPKHGVRTGARDDLKLGTAQHPSHGG